MPSPFACISGIPLAVSPFEGTTHESTVGILESLSANPSRLLPATILYVYVDGLSMTLLQNYGEVFHILRNLRAT